MGYYLDDHPNTTLRQQRPRRASERGIIGVHTAESFPDEVPPDTGAENVARFISDRSNYGSYHAVCDSDSIVLMVRDTWAAFHIGVADLNDWSYGISAATQAHKWDNLSPDWIDDTVTNMARAAANYAIGLQRRENIIIPARRISRSEALDGVPGHIAHGDADPDRRTDPGRLFPWHDYLARFEMFVNGKEVDEMQEADFDRIERIVRDTVFDQKVNGHEAGDVKPTVFDVLGRVDKRTKRIEVALVTSDDIDRLVANLPIDANKETVKTALRELFAELAVEE